MNLAKQQISSKRGSQPNTKTDGRIYKNSLHSSTSARNFVPSKQVNSVASLTEASLGIRRSPKALDLKAARN